MSSFVRFDDNAMEFTGIQWHALKMTRKLHTYDIVMGILNLRSFFHKNVDSPV